MNLTSTLQPVITGELKSKIDRIWDAFWSGGISNPLEVIEQITYLLFIRRLDDLQTLAEKKANRTGKPIENPVFQPGQADLRWSRFKDIEPGVMHKLIAEQVFPFLRGLGGDGSTYSEHMKDARFTIAAPALLSRVVDMLDDVPMSDRDTSGDLYEYMLSKIATAGTNGQFRTPRHIIQLMVEMTAPRPTDEICDPACGTAGFLVAASEYVRDTHPSVMTDERQWKHYHHSMFHGYDFDSTMLRIGSMNMLLHGVEQPDIRYRDSLSEGAAGEETRYSLILANPPFAGSLDYESTSKDLQRVVKTKKTELLFLALFLRLLKPGGRAAVIVPDGGCSDPPRPTRSCDASSSRTRSSTPSSSSPPASSGRTPGSPQPSCSSPRPTPAAPTTSCSTTSKPTGSASTTSATQSTPMTCPTFSPGGHTATATSGSARAPSRASTSPRPTSSPRATSSRSTGTRKSSTTTPNIAPRLRSSAT